MSNGRYEDSGGRGEEIVYGLDSKETTKNLSLANRIEEMYFELGQVIKLKWILSLISYFLQEQIKHISIFILFQVTNAYKIHTSYMNIYFRLDL